MPAVGANVTIKLAPNRRRMAKSMTRLIDIIYISDSKLYNRGKAFLPIFPTTDDALNAAVALVKARCELILNPQPVG